MKVRALVNRISELEKSLSVKDAKIAALESAHAEAVRRVHDQLVSKQHQQQHNKPVSGTLTTSSSFTMLDNLSETKSDESVVVVPSEAARQGQAPSKPTHDPKPAASVHVQSKETPGLSTAAHLVKPGPVLPASVQTPVSLDEDEDDGWT
jgi:hypothetical protein